MTEKYIQAERKCSMDAALALLGIEMPVDKVAKYTQLTVKEVEQLRQSGDLPVDIRNINVRRIGLDENETAKLRSRRKYLSDLVSDFITAYESGVEEGAVLLSATGLTQQQVEAYKRESDAII